MDEDAIAEAELFDGKLALLTNAPDLDLAEAVARYKALADIASPRTALDLLARIHRHQVRIAERSLEGTTRLTPEQLDLFDALTLPKPA